MIFRSIVLFVATSALGVALACGGAACDSCDKAAKSAASPAAARLRSGAGVRSGAILRVVQVLGI